ncbi:hypothetical protein AHAS_Ahas13G0355900 [Arachis hypogaea]
MIVRGCPYVWNGFQEKVANSSAGESTPASTCRGHVRHTSAGESAPARSRNLKRLCPGMPYLTCESDCVGCGSKPTNQLITCDRTRHASFLFAHLDLVVFAYLVSL